MLLNIQGHNIGFFQQFLLGYIVSLFPSYCKLTFGTYIWVKDVMVDLTQELICQFWQMNPDFGKLSSKLSSTLASCHPGSTLDCHPDSGAALGYL